MGYGLPLPAPIPAVQTTLSAIDLHDLHKFIQENDTVTFTNYEEKDAHMPLLIDSLDLALWTSLFITTTNDPNITIANIKSAHIRLSDLFLHDEHEANKSIGTYSVIEEMLKMTNNNALKTHAALPVAITVDDFFRASNTIYPQLSKLKILSMEMTALEDFTEGIQFSQNEKEKQLMVNTKGPLIHVKPQRCVEIFVADYQHMM